MDNYLYHFVLNIERLDSILNNGILLMHNRITPSCVCLTRDKNYLTNRGIRMVFDREKLKFNYRVLPFSYRGWILNNYPASRFIPIRNETEERVYSDIVLSKCLVSIDVDKHKFPNYNHQKYTVNLKPFHQYPV
jgi:hypothetical protein